MGDYVDVVRERLVADGCEVTAEQVAGAPAVVGYRSNWRALSKMHLFTVVAESETVDAAALEQFTRETSLLAKRRKGAMRGAQSGVFAIAVLVTEYADEAAKELAGRPFRQGLGGFAALVQPAVVDLTDKKVYSFRGKDLGRGVRLVPAEEEQAVPARPAVAGAGRMPAPAGAVSRGRPSGSSCRPWPSAGGT